MTELADAPPSLTTLHHWIAGREHPGASGAQGPVFNPAAARRAPGSTSPIAGEVDLAVAAAATPFPPGASSRSPGAASSSSRSASSSTRTVTSSRVCWTAEHGKVLADAPRRGRARTRGRRVLLRHPTLLKGEFSEQVLDGIDVYSLASRSASYAGSPPSTSPRWSHVVWAPALACGNTFVLKPSEKAPSASPAGWPSCSPRRASHEASQRRPRRQRRGRGAALPTRRRGGLVRRLDPGRARRLRPAPPRRASAARPSAEPRITWWCCPTPTSRWPPTPPFRPATARPGSAAWPSRWSSPSAGSPTSSSPRSSERLPAVRVGDGLEPGARWARSSRARTGTRSPPPRARPRRGRRARRRRARAGTGG